MGFFGKLFGKGHEASAGTATDPVCGMTVDPAKAAGKSMHGAETYFFCSSSCKGKFDKDPHKYLGAHSH